MKFEGETLNIGGFDLTGTIEIEVRQNDASFSHEFGTESVNDIEIIPVAFVPDLKVSINWTLAEWSILDWVDKNEQRVMMSAQK